ncbi:MAG: indole-3-glycerol phosphate synthase TrpC [Rikenellaceae bacterium]|nr:indole-3-glycerol phosphate synthase TrpC [Rikenellaceae bacterium]
MNILEHIIETKQTEVAAAKAARPFTDIYADAQAVKRPTVSFSGSIARTPGGIIAEFKRRSPSKGDINSAASVEEVVAGYEAAGAAAVSVLTDGDYFGGSLADLRTARGVAALPLLRKDFIIDPYQICEARTAGADAILLIAANLTVERTADLAAFAKALGLEVLLELHGPHELDHVCDDVDVVGINNRDLTTFVTDTAVSVRMAELLPAGKLLISESGISDPATVRKLARHGYRGFLMGENFMKHGDPAGALRTFLGEVLEK